MGLPPNAGLGPASLDACELANLDENKDHGLTGNGKKTSCVDNGQAGDAGGGCGGEKGIKPGDGVPAQAEGSMQQQSAEADNCSKENDGHGKGGQQRFHVEKAMVRIALNRQRAFGEGLLYQLDGTYTTDRFVPRKEFFLFS